MIRALHILSCVIIGALLATSVYLGLLLWERSHTKSAPAAMYFDIKAACDLACRNNWWVNGYECHKEPCP
jgi:hypothetical protein